MKITRISLYHLELPLIEPYHLSRGRRFEKFESTFVKIDTDSGIKGWGELAPWGNNYLPAFPGGIRMAIAALAPHLIGRDPREVEVLNRLMDEVLAGHIYAKAAVDYALWDILGKAVELPIYALLGGKEVSNEMPLVSSIHVDTPEAMLKNIEHWRSLGYRRHSIKLGDSVSSDIDRVMHLADKRKTGEEFIFDANGGWSPLEAVRILNAVSDKEAWFEQPCINYDECLAVRRQTRQALSLDECIVDMRDLVRAINDRACEVVNIKVARVGGITKARKLRDLCLAYDISMLVMCMAGTVINDTVGAHFGQTIPGNRFVGTWSCQEMVTVDPAPGRGARNVNGNMTPPDLPGLGVEPDLELLGEPAAVFA
ncbi:mandelate racemase/muconate lactonizing enzyme family protein [Rhizobium sp. 2YAF20]|uniref:mandelate racemase/muconate lactonizing enzyme family protein n=1 Tax=Rhizobium sp. 2YAF20 TaxID=3233027 RepID=UPI003F9DC040